MGPLVLFTHLKKNGYSVFSFQQNKLYPNGPLEIQFEQKKVSFSFHSLLSFALHISHNFLLLSLFFSSLLLAHSLT